jgi:cystathionine beta-lyase/cystathionine gamma-synthase
VGLHPKGQGLQPAQDQEAVQGPGYRAGRVLDERQPILHLLRRRHGHAANDIRVAPEIFRRRVDDRVGAVGGVPGPQDCFLVLRGLKTLAVRMEAHCRNAARVAEFLADHERVKQVYYPGLPRHPGHDIAAKQMRGSGGMVSFEMETEDQALEVCGRTRLFFLAESLGGVESLIEHPGRMTHMSVAGSPLEVPATLVRLSVGIEHPDDLIEDLSQALT